MHGYTRMFEKMLAHPNIKVMLNTDYREIVDLVPWKHMVYTGPIDAFFDHRHGKLPYRSLEFRHVNAAAGAVPAGRHGQLPERLRATRASASSSTSPASSTRARRSSTSTRAPRAIRTTRCRGPRTRRSTSCYEADAEQLTNVTFVGRLATYKYYNMDQVVGQALTAFKRLQLRLVERTPRTPRRRRLIAASCQARSSGGASRRPRPPRRR